MSGARAFLPASRCGIRDAAEMQKLVGQEIRCRIIKLDVDDEDVVVDRRSVMEEEADQVSPHHARDAGRRRVSCAAPSGPSPIWRICGYRRRRRPAACGRHYLGAQ